MEPENIPNWINASALERAIGCPRGTIEQWLSGRRNLPKKWEAEIKERFKGLFILTIN